MSKQKKRIYAKYFKRPLDLILSILALIVLSPLLLIIAILVRINLGKPIIFKQQRPGLNEKIFTLYKFRTMTNKKNKNNNLLPDEERLTRFGKWLRSTSIDELPELINIIKGDMSIVGPRPLATIYLPFYTEKERVRHSIRPGLTGLAQVSGRINIPWEKRFQYDIQYLEVCSFFIDLKIIFKTIKNVITRKDSILHNSDNYIQKSLHIERKGNI